MEDDKIKLEMEDDKKKMEMEDDQTKLIGNGRRPSQDPACICFNH